MRAVVVTQNEDSPSVALQEFDQTSLEGEVLVAVAWSTINFKDAMVTQARNRVARRSPLIGGVDLAGRVVSDSTGSLNVGDEVIVHGHGLGVANHGGFAEFARVPAEWVVPLPDGLSLRESMIAGTAGFTAMASFIRLTSLGITPSSGPILVTGASGGVGSTAVALLGHAGFDVVASTGKSAESAYLLSLGAREVIGREDIDDAPQKTFGSERWAGAIDCVGGATLHSILRSLRYGGVVAASGLTGGSQLETTVYPFIVRGVSLLGIDAVEMPSDQRRAIWETFSVAMPKDILDSIVDLEIGLREVPSQLERVAHGAVRGRILIDATKDEA